MATGKALVATTQFYQNINPLSYRVNEATAILDPVFHTKLLRVKQLAQEKYAFIAGINTVDTLNLEGRELLFNRLSGPHLDSQDPHLAWAALFAAGAFTGGEIYFPQLNLTVRLSPGDAVWVRGRVVVHQILPWAGGQRISIPHFTHTSFWREFGMEGEVLL